MSRSSPCPPRGEVSGAVLAIFNRILPTKGELCGWSYVSFYLQVVLPFSFTATYEKTCAWALSGVRLTQILPVIFMNGAVTSICKKFVLALILKLFDITL